ncbi:hypothetical protein GCM10007216_04380 [Thalassobacillus devorans]|uniref:Tyr recombinase domain-containing protein n=1 Tax=Thalassobacillus devorans TaxID=279813 RepID=A0ABQ1NH31_9BACI|nr:tyrosine-type recombinase/integrase [Thalassobacillus devorans]GGC77016.1 hypothetical protein GCM10007216_04380 [Thalassobacillus devorans]
MINNGAPIDVIQSLLGHEKSETTNVYAQLSGKLRQDFYTKYLWETRKVYPTKNQLLKDLSERTGRSILHELDDNELRIFINHVDKSLSSNKSIIEKDRWTI